MSSVIFIKIGTTDLTEYADYQNGELNREDVYETWTDANYVIHREVARRRISGKITLGFASATSYAAFQTIMAAVQTTGYASVTAYVHNVGAEVTFNAYIDMEATAKWDLVNSREWHEVELTITER